MISALRTTSSVVNKAQDPRWGEFQQSEELEKQRGSAMRWSAEGDDHDSRRTRMAEVPQVTVGFLRHGCCCKNSEVIIAKREASGS